MVITSIKILTLHWEVNALEMKGCWMISTLHVPMGPYVTLTFGGCFYGEGW